MNISPFWRKLDNLGDAPLNSWLLPRLFPRLGAYGDTNADCLMFGIGSLIGNHRAASDMWPQQRSLPRILFSTGSYHPESLPEGSHVLCVRGKWTCRNLGIDERYAVADGAILLPLYLKIGATPNAGIATIEKCEWRGRETPNRFSTRTYGDFLGFVRRMLSFKIIRTHSMHAAIIADAYGVPWLPLRWEAKWADHFEQLGIIGRPTRPVLSSRSLLAIRQEQLMEALSQCNY